MESISQPSSRSFDRRESVWSACDTLAAEGVKPTLSKIRPLHRGGSDTDVQSDIQAWFAQVFKAHSAQADGMGMPKEIAALMRGLWDAALGSADAQLLAQREALEKTEAAAALAIESAETEKQAALERANGLDRELAAEREKSTGLARSGAELEARWAESKAEAKQERSRADRLASELAAMDLRHMELMAALREEAGALMRATRQSHAQEMAIIREQMKQRSDHFDNETKQSEERLRSIEKRLLLEQDAVRQSVSEWKRKAQEEREAGELKESVVRRQMEGALAQAAGLLAKLAANEDNLVEARRAAERAQDELTRMARAAMQPPATPAPILNNESAV